jgi:hypothetical protein
MAVSVHQKRPDAEKRGDSGTYGSVFGRKTERISVLSETVDIGLSRQRRLDPQILRLEHEWVTRRVEQRFVAARTRRAHDSKAEWVASVLKFDVGRGTRSTPSIWSGEHAFWDRISLTSRVAYFHVNSII